MHFFKHWVTTLILDWEYSFNNYPAILILKYTTLIHESTYLSLSPQTQTNSYHTHPHNLILNPIIHSPRLTHTIILMYLLDIRDGPSLQRTPSEPLVITGGKGGHTDYGHVGQGVSFATVCLWFGAPVYILLCVWVIVIESFCNMKSIRQGVFHQTL